MDHGARAEEAFYQGYNCAQALNVSFSDLTGLEEQAAARMASAFGGGMGRMREVCGAVSGMLLVLGQLYGYDTPGDDESKKALYTDVQALAGRFREEAGSILCRDILNNPPADPNPTPRTPAYYRSRPCGHVIRLAGQLMDEYIEAHPREV